MDGGFLVGLWRVGVADDAGHKRLVVGDALDHDDAAFGLELVEDEVHDGLEELAVVHDARGERGEGVDDAEVIDGDAGGVGVLGGVGADVGVGLGDDAFLDLGLHVELVGDEHGGFLG